MNHLEVFSTIHTFIFDVDGVLTNNEVLITENGELLRKMNVRDGLAIKIAIDKGYKIAIITGGRSEGVKKRLEALGIKDIYSGISDKLEAFEEFVNTYELDPVGILYMGDDLPDYPVLRRVGLATCPKNSAPELFPIVNYVSPLNGGEGCVRDVIEKVLRLQGKWSED
ncbi:KdsC family phosphatase [Haliscomenobacter sp.]|uniref:KdsC family phosphatase n=1 Tax=Haliscomenobacter sp. TaxID=2717303 RepID=UPI003BA8B3A3